MRHLIFFLCLLPTLSFADVSSRISSRFLTRGEKALLEISVTGTKPKMFPRIIQNDQYSIQPASNAPVAKPLPGKKIEWVFDYIISSYQVGSHTISPIEIDLDGTKHLTPAIDFVIYNPDELQWLEASAGNTRFKYAAAIKALKSNVYDGESTPVEIKLFVPSDLMVIDWGIPDIERDGLTAWRFQAAPLKSSVNLLGSAYTSISYPSTITPTRSGTIGIGPATVRLITTQVIMDGFLRRINSESQIQIPKLQLNATPLPEGAPNGFENAVGDFQLNVSTDQVEFKEGEPIAVDVTISGTGNLDSISIPKSTAPDGWKFYDASPANRGEERLQQSGKIVFRQLIRSNQLKSEIPPFRFVFFNPAKQTYETLVSNSIPIQMKPSATPSNEDMASPIKSVPIERMTDILGLINTPDPVNTSPSRWPNLWLHIVGAISSLSLLAFAIRNRKKHALHLNTAQASALRTLKEIENQSLSDISFIQKVCQIVEPFLKTKPHPEMEGLIQQRDLYAYQQDKSIDLKMDHQRRLAILKIVRQTIKTSTLILCFVLAQRLHADPQTTTDPAHQAYLKADYANAIAIWQKNANTQPLSANTLYHIGNAQYRLGNPGYANLYYQRALLKQPSHVEAKQNSKFITRKYGSITPTLSAIQYIASSLTIPLISFIQSASVWLVVLSAIAFMAFYHNKRIKITTAALCIVSLLTCLASTLAWFNHPNNPKNPHITSTAFIVSNQAKMRVDASRNSAEIMDAPPASTCQVIHQANDWTYVAINQETRGWLLSKDIELLIPAASSKNP